MKSQNNFDDKDLSPKKPRKNFIKSFKYAANGIKECAKRELNFKIHIAATVCVFVFSYFFKVPKNEFILLLFCIMTVLSAELINTVVEELCNIIDEKYNERIKYIKDLSAGTVLISAVFSIVTGLIVFVPYLFEFFKNFIK